MKKFLISIIFIALIIATTPTISLLNENTSNKNSENINKTFEKVSKLVTISDTSKNTVNPKDDFFNIYDKSTDKVLKVSKEEFCCNALITQVEEDYPVEAMKALAITINTYYSYIKANDKSDSKQYDFECNSKVWDIYVSTEQIKEKLGDTFNDTYNIFKKTVKQIKNKLIYYNNKVCITPFFEISSGTTNSYKEIYGKDIPYLTNTPSPFDKTANNYKTTTVITKEELDSIFSNTIKNYNKNNHQMSEIKKNNYGTVLSLKIGDNIINGIDFYNSLKLRSNCFDIKQDDDKCTITTYGYGENIGLSKYGASQLAKQGYSYEEIIKYYFCDTDIISNTK